MSLSGWWIVPTRLPPCGVAGGYWRKAVGVFESLHVNLRKQLFVRIQVLNMLCSVWGHPLALGLPLRVLHYPSCLNILFRLAVSQSLVWGRVSAAWINFSGVSRIELPSLIFIMDHLRELYQLPEHNWANYNTCFLQGIVVAQWIQLQSRRVLYPCHHGFSVVFCRQSGCT